METTNFIEPVNESASPKRPKMLMVLCILSFICCGLGLLGGIYNIIQNRPEAMAENIEKLRQVMPEMADRLEQNMIEAQENVYMQIVPYLNFVYLLISFMGIFMMWKLNRKGYLVYLAGELLPYVGFIVAAKPMLAMMGGGGMMANVGLISTIFMVVFDLLFIILYRVALKKIDEPILS